MIIISMVDHRHVNLLLGEILLSSVAKHRRGCHLMMTTKKINLDNVLAIILPLLHNAVVSLVGEDLAGVHSLDWIVERV